MPINKRGVASELETNIETIEAYLEDDAGIVERYRNAFQRLPDEWTTDEIRASLQNASYPGAYPTDEFDDVDSLIVPYPESDGWENHEEVNEWARRIVRDVPVIQRTYYRLASAERTAFEPTASFFDALESAFVWTYLGTVEETGMPDHVEAGLDSALDHDGPAIVEILTDSDPV